MPNTQVTSPVGARVGPNVLSFRRDQGLTLRELSEALAECGTPISLGQLSKLEQGQRRVDADELVALAVVLNVTPAQLLMPMPGHRSREDEVVRLAPNVSASWFRAWQWMCGDHWLNDADRPRDDEAEYDWYQSAHPHKPDGVYNFSPNQIRGHEAAVAKVIEAARRAARGGLSARQLIMALDWYLAVSPEGQLPAEGE